MKRSLLISALVLCALSVYGQDFSPEITRAVLESRGSYVINRSDGAIDNNASGFLGEYLQFLLSVDITDHLSFDYRQKLAKPIKDGSFFDATDKLLLIYRPDSNFEFRAGKRPVAIGGCDYAIIPIDLYLTGQYCDLLTIYQWGLSGKYITGSGKDSFTLELTQSPFRTYSSNRNIYAYSFLYEGSHSIYEAIHSVNFFGTETGKYVNWIMLGNRFNIGSKFVVEADVLNKFSMAGRNAESRNAFLFKDFSLVGKLIYNPAEKLSLALKYCYDRNACKYESSLQMMTENCDYHVLPGTEVNRMGAILEYFPLSGSYRNFVRLHATVYYDWGNNTDPEGTVVDGHVFVSFGATVKLDFLKIRH